MKILHYFADYGTESETLSDYGTVTRATIDPKENGVSEPIVVDCSDPDTLPFRDNEFDLGLGHPVCSKWATMTNNNGTHDEHPDYIEEARAIGERYCSDYILENVPGAPLNDPVVLNGKSFGLPIVYERAFETSFPVNQPPRQQPLDTETSSYYYPELPPKWWASIKGVPSGKYPKEHVAKNATPVAYLQFILRQYFKSADSEERSDYDDYDSRMKARKRKDLNSSLSSFES